MTQYRNSPLFIAGTAACLVLALGGVLLWISHPQAIAKTVSPSQSTSSVGSRLDVALLSESISNIAIQADVKSSPVQSFLESHCTDCHNADSKKGGLDLTSLPFKPGDARHFAAWEKVFDRVSSGEMPPKKRERPEAKELEAFTKTLKPALVEADRKRIAAEGRAIQRRLNGYDTRRVA